MADFNALEALINAHIKKNGVQAITGNILNGILRGMVSALGKGYTIAGVAVPSSDPGTMTGPLAYLAYTAGTYTHFGGLEVDQGEVSMLIYNEAEWHKEVLFILSATATVDDNVGTPEVGVSFVDGLLTFDFRNMKGNPGNDGDAAGFGTINATVDGNVGTPSVSVQSSGPDTAKNFTFAFHNLKGETGVTSVVATVDNTVGTPTCTVSLVGQQLTLAFSGLKGAPGDTGSSVDYPFTIVNNLTTNDATQALSAAMGVQLEAEVSQLEAEVDELDIQIHGRESAVILDLTAKISKMTYAPNTLELGDKFTLEFIIGASNATRFAFSKNNTGTDWVEENDAGNLEFFKNQSTAGKWQGEAPDPSVYPYLVYQKASASNEIVLTRDKVVGELETIENECAKETEVAPLVEDMGKLVTDNVITKEFTQTTWSSGFQDFALKKGRNYKITLRVTNWGTGGINVNFYASASSSATHENVNSIFGGPDAIKSGNAVTAEYTPTFDIFKVITQGTSSSYTPLDGCTIKIVSVEELVKPLPLYGKRVLMLGDSITQLPRTGTATTGNGIVEYFALYTGAETIRGAVGGSHIRGRRDIETAADITDINTAKAAFDIVYIVKALCTQDWTLQDAAITWLGNNEALDAYLPTILADLKAVDMSILDVLTIFAGTNDYANSVPLNDSDSTSPADSTNTQVENGAWNYILSTLANTYKNLSVFIFTPIVKIIGGVWCEETQNSQGLKVSDYAENNLAAARRYQYPGCDLFHTMGWNKYNFSTFAPDGTHPTQGFDCIARKMAGFVTSNFNR